MKKTIISILKLLRPRQWVKNFFLFAAATFGGGLSNPTILLNTFYGFLVFCAVSSSIYVINDLFDMEKDRLHPFKRFRPLANKDIPVPVGRLIAFILAAGSLWASYYISPLFFILTIIYFILQFSYSMYLKHIEIIDILALAAGYILRVYGGELISGPQYHISVWLLLTTISISLFLAVGKRRRELTLVSGTAGTNIAAIRKTLSHYSERLLDVYLSIFATSTFAFYALFTFLGSVSSTSNRSINNPILMPDFISDQFQRKWLMITILPVVYGLMRYLQDIYEKHEGESPEKVIFSDRPLLASIIIWFALVIIIIYFVQGFSS